MSSSSHARRALAALALIGGLRAVSPAQAQDIRDAETLPKNAGGLIIAPSYSNGTDRFGPKFRFFSRESILTDYSGINLSQVIAGDQAATLDGLLGQLGTTGFEATQNSFGLGFTLAYGITDRWTVAAMLPWATVTYALDAWLDPSETNPSHYRVKNPQAIQCPNGELQVDATSFPELVEYVDESYKFNVGDLRNALTSQCLGYKDPLDRVEAGPGGVLHGYGSRTYSGFRDLILGTKYQFFHGEWLRLAGTFYVVAPTGHYDDPDDLFDVQFGDGQWDIGWIAQSTFVYGKLKISLSPAYDIQIADSIVRRLFGLTFDDALEAQLASGAISEAQLYDDHLDDGSQVPLVTAYEKALVDRKLGNNIYLYTAATYELTEWMTLALNLDFLHHFRDEVTDTGTRIADGSRLKTSAEIRAEVDAEINAEVNAGTLPADQVEIQRLSRLRGRLPESAERKAASYGWHTVRSSVVASFGVGFNTLGLFVRDEFPIPLLVTVNAQVPLGGKNLDAINNFGITLTVPFLTGEIKDPAEYGFDDEEGEGRGLPWP